MPNTFDLILFRLFVFWYVSGVILLTFSILPPALEWANAIFLILAGTLGGTYFIRNYGFVSGVCISLFIIIFTILVEWVGVTYGLFFGHYYYNPDFGLFIFDLPLTIGFAWLMVIATTHVIAKQLTIHLVKLRFLAFAFVGALAAVIMDLILDPVAYLVKQYWIWNTDGIYYGIPFSNFAGWFCLAFVIHLIIYLLLLTKWEFNQNPYWKKRMVILYVLMIMMFTILALNNGLFFAPIITVTLVVPMLILYNTKKESHYD
ncbi:carotenoid biosynthesis protein [Halalkalibacter akibai]|uniref:Membrane protein n=1 Tax=Halalkalibacter akibai (strain ATCC 43226 / DSM 21942 / CIP 109018 / JCM 9157 / 1139) TaxID=1236973 RepID=W4QNS4_HALA3|nr:carotenoid biosynthesis protein [Halalkalibacter akibai]GAE33547.1 membrane protein [Halalkalibacter akibai JCM 9157]